MVPSRNHVLSPLVAASNFHELCNNQTLGLAATIFELLEICHGLSRKVNSSMDVFGDK